MRRATPRVSRACVVSCEMMWRASLGCRALPGLLRGSIYWSVPVLLLLKRCCCQQRSDVLRFAVLLFAILLLRCAVLLLLLLLLRFHYSRPKPSHSQTRRTHYECRELQPDASPGGAKQEQ